MIGAPSQTEKLILQAVIFLAKESISEVNNIE